MTGLPEAWAPKPAEWVPLAPGVKWLLRRPNGLDSRVVAAEVARMMGKVYQGRAALDALGIDLDQDGGEVLDLERIAAYASVMTACLTAQRCLEDWEGIDDPGTGAPLDFKDPENIRAALIHGAPPEGQSLLAPFLSWIETPRRPMTAEAVRLRARAKDWWGGGSARCLACADENDACSKGGSEAGQLCPQLENTAQTPAGILAWELATTLPGLWDRAGMEGRVTGLKYADALLAFEGRCAADRAECDHGAAFAAFRAIETGCLEAVADKAASTET